MTIEEAQAKKKALEEEILGKLITFMHETGLSVERIGIEYTLKSYVGKNIDIVQVIVDVRI